MGALVAIVLCGLIALLVAYAPLVAAIIFLLAVVAIFILSVRSQGFWKASWEAMKRLLTGW